MNSNHKHWLKLITITGSAQVLVQALGFVCGILIIRLLPVEEYALYVLANTMLGTMTILSDGGISAGVMAEGGKVWQDKQKLGVVLATGLDLRRKFAIGSLIIATPVLLYLLFDNGASWLMAVMIVLSLIPPFYASLSDTLLQIVPKLHQNIAALQKNQVEVSIGRLVLIFATVFIFPLAFVTILANGIPRIYGNIRLRKIAEQNIVSSQTLDKEVRSNILKVVKRILPGAAYYAISGQLIIWLASIFANTTSVAQLGALSRISMLLSLFTVMINMLLIPRFARLALKKSLLLKRYIQIMGVVIVIMLITITFITILSDPILWVLGKNYKGLNAELVLSIIAGTLSLLAGMAFNLYTSRGWVLNPILNISLSIATIIFGLLVYNISNLLGLLYLNITIALMAFLINGFYCFYKIIKIEKVQSLLE